MSELTVREHKLAENLLEAAYAFWKERTKNGCGAAIQWVSNTDGRTVIFTRSEYNDTLMRNVDFISDTKYFDHIEGNDDE